MNAMILLLAVIFRAVYRVHILTTAATPSSSGIYECVALRYMGVRYWVMTQGALDV